MTDSPGQATVELALVLPVVVVLALTLVQVALVLRDQAAVVAAAREAARTASVDPDPRSPAHAAERVLPGARVRLGPPPPPGEALSVEVLYRSPTNLPLIGPLLPDPELRSVSVMRVEW
jgi:TadE-like protein